MANKGYIGIGNYAKPIKRLYVGINGQAKKVKKAYIGVNGQARLWYQSRQNLVTSGSLDPIMGTPQFWDTGNGHHGSISYPGGYITVNVDGWADGDRWGTFTSENKIDLTPYSKFVGVIQQSASGRSGGAGLTVRSSVYANGEVAGVHMPNEAALYTVSLDISNLNGYYYVGACASGHAVGQGNTFWIYDLWLE